jgi:predicted MPP superfamily phosphohydrolase
MDVRLDHARSQVTKKLGFHRGRTESDIRDTSILLPLHSSRRVGAVLLCCFFFSFLFSLLLLFPAFFNNFQLPSFLSSPSSTPNNINNGHNFQCTDQIFHHGRILRPANARVVVIPDVHGDVIHFRQALIAAELVDEAPPYSWRRGCHDILVLLGDLVDRGPDTKQVLESVIRWSKEAKMNGGRVVPLLGNHELMAMSGVTRYVDEKDMASFGGEQGRQQAFSSRGMLGSWLRCLNVVIIIDKDLYVHAGLLPKWIHQHQQQYSSRSRSSSRRSRRRRKSYKTDHTTPEKDHSSINILNNMGRAAMLAERWQDPLFKSKGPLWTRLLARGKDEQQVCALLDETLLSLNVTRMVVGHTRQHVRVGQRCHGKLLLLDTGMSIAYDANPAILVVRHRKDEEVEVHVQSEIIYPARDNVRLERRVTLENIEETRLHHEELMEEHRLSLSDRARRDQLKRDFLLTRDRDKKKTKKYKLRHTTDYNN